MLELVPCGSAAMGSGAEPAGWLLPARGCAWNPKAVARERRISVPGTRGSRDRGWLSLLWRRASRRHELPGRSGCRLWQMQGEAPHSSLPSSSVTRVPGARQNQMWEHFPSDLFRRHWQESFNLFNLFPPALLLTLVQCRSRSSCDTPRPFPPPNSRAGRPGAFSEPPGLRFFGNRCSR